MKKYIAFLIAIIAIITVYNRVNRKPDYDAISDEVEVIFDELAEAYQEQNPGKIMKAQQKLDSFTEKYQAIDETQMTAAQINRSLKITAELYEKLGIAEAAEVRKLFNNNP